MTLYFSELYGICYISFVSLINFMTFCALKICQLFSLVSVSNEILSTTTFFFLIVNFMSNKNIIRDIKKKRKICMINEIKKVFTKSLKIVPLRRRSLSNFWFGTKPKYCFAFDVVWNDPNTVF